MAPPALACDSPPLSPRLKQSGLDLEVEQIPVMQGETPVKLVIGGLSFKAGIEYPTAVAASSRVQQQAAAFVSKVQPNDIPSYLRSTAATQARSKGIQEEEAVKVGPVAFICTFD